MNSISHNHEFKILFIDGLNVGSYLRDTLLIDKIASQDEAILGSLGDHRTHVGTQPTLVLRVQT